MARALFETFNISPCELLNVSFCFVLKEEAAASKRLVLLNFNFSAIEQSSSYSVKSSCIKV